MDSEIDGNSLMNLSIRSVITLRLVTYILDGILEANPDANLSFLYCRLVSCVGPTR